MATEIYSVFFSLLKEVVADKLSSTGFKLKKVLCDYEVGLHNAVKENFGSDIEIAGCFFHYTQCLYQKVLSSGMEKNTLGPDQVLENSLKWPCLCHTFLRAVLKRPTLY